MNSLLKQRAILLGEHIVKTGQTVRQTAIVFGVSKSTVHNDVSNKLKKIDYELYLKTKVVLDKNFNEKHIRGGQATKHRWRCQSGVSTAIMLSRTKKTT